MFDLSIIIVSYKVKELLINCLKSIYRQESDLNFEVIVVDNCSKDGSVKMVRELFPETKLLENKQNLGFAHANNQGFFQSNGRNILFLNPDTVVLPGAFKKTVRFIDQHPEIGVVGCKILNPDGSLQYSCRSFPNLLNYFLESTFLYKIFPGNRIVGRFYMTHFEYDLTEEVDVILGAFLLIKREVLKEVGKFDERFFIYSEETDLCYRVRKAGKKVLFFPEAEIIHYGGSSTSFDSMGMVQQEHKSRFLFMRKYHKPLAVWSSVIVIFLGVILRFILWSLVTGYCVAFDKKKLASARKKMSTFGHLLGWYSRFGFKKSNPIVSS